MLFIKQSNYEKFQDNTKRLTNCFVYILSDNLEIKDTDDLLVGVGTISALRPSAALIKQFKAGEITEGKFRAAYKQELASYERKFLVYMIVRAICEKNYMPVFLFSDEDADLGYIDVLQKYLKKKFGLKPLKMKKYSKDVNAIFKAAKREAGKKKKVKKTARKMLKEYVSDKLQLSSDGFKLLEKMDKRFSIDRIALTINQADDPDDISKKVIVPIIKDFAHCGKKQYKIVKRAAEELGISKKSDRWSRRDAANLVIQIYNTIHAEPETVGKKK